MHQTLYWLLISSINECTVPTRMLQSYKFLLVLVCLFSWSLRHRCRTVSCSLLFFLGLFAILPAISRTIAGCRRVGVCCFLFSLVVLLYCRRHEGCFWSSIESVMTLWWILLFCSAWLAVADTSSCHLDSIWW